MLSRLINIRAMADALREHRVMRGEFLCYAGITIIAFIYLILEFFGFTPDTGFSYQPTYLRTVEFIMSEIIFFLSLFISYKINKRGDNRDFWYRYFSLGFPISILGIIIFFIFVIVAGIFGFIDMETITYKDLTIQFLVGILMIYWTQKYMRYIVVSDKVEQSE